MIIPSNGRGALRWADVACRCFLLSRACNRGLYIERAFTISYIYIYMQILCTIYIYTIYIQVRPCARSEFADKYGKRKKRGERNEENARGKKKMTRKGASEGRYSDPPSAHPNHPSGIYDTYMYYLPPTNNPLSEPLLRWRWIKEKKKNIENQHR